jgi:hypothetical protein
MPARAKSHGESANTGCGSENDLKSRIDFAITAQELIPVALH